jgi:hypothetical protein
MQALNNPRQKPIVPPGPQGFQHGPAIDGAPIRKQEQISRDTMNCDESSKPDNSFDEEQAHQLNH